METELGNCTHVVKIKLIEFRRTFSANGENLYYMKRYEPNFHVDYATNIAIICLFTIINQPHICLRDIVNNNQILLTITHQHRNFRYSYNKCKYWQLL